MKYLKEKFIKIIILDDFVEVRWSGPNIPYYKGLGYTYTNAFDKFFVSLEHLPHQAKVNVRVQCPMCDNERMAVYGNVIRYGHTVCSGCSRIKDMIGEKYGRWTVLDVDYGRSMSDGAYWMCECECGTISSVNRGELINGNSKSCGCYQRDAISGENNVNWKPNVINICENCGEEYEISQWESKKRRFCCFQCFFEYTALRNGWNLGETTLTCEQCGKEYSRPSRLNGISRFCSKPCQFNWMSENTRGENSPNWKIDILRDERNKKRILPENKKWVRDVLERDDYTCRICGAHGGKLTAHHLYSYSNYPEKKFDLDNGLTICQHEHKEFHLWMGGYRVPCTPTDFDRWLSETQYNKHS